MCPVRDGVPDGLLGELLCGTWGVQAPTAVWGFVRLRWPLLLATLAVLATLNEVAMSRSITARHPGKCSTLIAT